MTGDYNENNGVLTTKDVIQYRKMTGGYNNTP